MRILVADDDLSVRTVLRHMCASAGHEAAVASSLAEVTELLKDGPYDAAACDLMMPEEGDGMESLQRCLKAGIPRVILITGAGAHQMGQVTPRLEALGVKALAKPFTVPELMRALGIEHTPQKTEGQPC